jgi:predicted dehydrogenase
MGRLDSRREFLQLSAGALAQAVGVSAMAAAPPRSANERVDFAMIGFGGRADVVRVDAARTGNIVALCDPDETALAKARTLYPRARTFTDYRSMLDAIRKSVDAVIVCTPDHHHATAAAQAIEMGKHCFVEKPLARTVWEVRRLCQLAHKHGVATQMGNQGTASGSLRHAAAMVRAGAIGTVTEVHCWTNRPIWPQGGPRPAPAAPPKTLHWDLWLGPAPDRPYGEGYHPFKWRGFWAFGSGALGDMGCHLINLPFMALDLRNVKAVTAESGPCNWETFPAWCTVRYEIAPTRHRPAVTLTWYDGGKRPPASLLPEVKLASSGSLMIGTKGKMYAPSDYGEKSTIFGGVEVGDVNFPLSPGHFDEFVRAIKTGVPAMAEFPSYGGPLSELALLGIAALRMPQRRLEWDSPALRFTNADLAETIKPRLRSGHHL